MSRKLVICPECGEGSTIAEWNKTTKRSLPPLPGYESYGNIVVRLSENDFNDYGLCIKDKPNSTEVTTYYCPKCHKEIYSCNLKMVVEDVDDKKEHPLSCPKCGSNDLYFVTTTSAHFEALPNGEMGNPILNQDGIDCIGQCASLEKENVEISCRNCNSHFNVEYSDNNDSEEWRYKIGDEI